MFEDPSVELLELIALELYHSEPTAGLADLRLVSRTISIKIAHIFAKLNFSTISTDLSRSSLNRLQSIAQNDLFCNAVRHVRVARFRSPEKEALRPLGHDLIWRRHEGDNTCLDLTASPAADFAITIASFTKCTHFRLLIVDGRSDSRAADQLQETDLLHVLLATLAREGAPRIEALNIFMGSHRLWCPHVDSILNSPSFQDAWSARLRNMKLSCTIQDGPDLDLLFKLVESAPHLRRLIIRDTTPRTVRNNYGGDTRVFWRRLASTLAPLRLEDLAIGRIPVAEPELLLNVVRGLRATLKSVRLSQVGFHSTRDDDWAYVFGVLAGTSLPALESFCFYSITVWQDSPVLFCPLRQDLGAMDSCAGSFGFVNFWETNYKKYLTGCVMYKGEGGKTQGAFQLLKEKHHRFGYPCQPQDDCPDPRRISDEGPPFVHWPRVMTFYGCNGGMVGPVRNEDF